MLICKAPWTPGTDSSRCGLLAARGSGSMVVRTYPILSFTVLYACKSHANAVINICKASDSMLENTASALQGLSHNVASPPRYTTKVFDLKIYLYLSQHLWRSKSSTLPSLPTGLIVQGGSGRENTGCMMCARQTIV